MNETVTLPREPTGDDDDEWMTETFYSHGPFDVTVTEITDNIVLEVDGEFYNMSDSTSDAAISVNSRTHTVELRNNSSLTITRPVPSGSADAGPDILRYHITSTQDEMHSPSGFEALDTIVELGAGESQTISKTESGHNLLAGSYTIEQIAAPDGYTLQLGDRDETVSPGEKGMFYINGNPGTLKLTAGGSENDGFIHSYVIERIKKESGDESVFNTRSETLESGKFVVVDNLPKGEYTITEHTINVNQRYTLNVTQTAERQEKSSGLSKTDTRKWIYFSLGNPNDPNFVVNSYKMDKFGPLYKGKNKLDNTYTYTAFAYAPVSSDGKIYTKDIKRYYREAGFQGGRTVTMSDAKEFDAPEIKKIGFAATGVSSSTPTSIGVKWYEYGIRTENFISANVYQTFTVDDRKQLTIMAPELPNPSAPGADDIVYYYTIANEDESFLQGVTYADGSPLPNEEDKSRNKRTVALLPGNSVELKLPAAGSYKILETIEGASAVGFEMEVKGHPFNTTETSTQLKVTVKNKRSLTISKPAVKKRDTRRYHFTVKGPNSFDKTINIGAGESSELIWLNEPGEYTIMPQNTELETYQLSYTDSGAIYGMVNGHTSSVTFTNTFSKDVYAYRYINEYYVKDPDGTYHHEGNSPIATVRGREGGEVYQASQIRKETNFNGLAYTHFDESYGWVDPLDPDISNGVTVDQKPRDRGSDPFTSKYQGVLVNGGTGVANTGNTQTPTRTLNYAPVASWDSAYVTTDAREIVILRYYRERNPIGHYQVIHEYYRRNDTGDHWEGQTQIEPRDGEIDVLYTAEKDVTLLPEFQPKGDKKYTYTWDGRARYGVTVQEQEGVRDDYTGQTKIYTVDTDWTSVKGTKEGDQIIILRYYRTPSKEGAYRIVHEYYYREEREGSDDVGEEDTSVGGTEDTPEEETPEEPFSAEGLDEGMEESGEGSETTDSQGYEALFDANAGITMQKVTEEEDPPPLPEPENILPAMEASGAPVQEASDPPPDPESSNAQPVFEEMGEDLPASEAIEPVLKASGTPLLLEDDEGQADPSGSEKTEEPLTPNEDDEPSDFIADDEFQNFRAAAEPSITDEDELDSTMEKEELIELYADTDEETGEETGDPSDDGQSFAGTLVTDGRFSYTFEGRREIQEYTALLGTTYKGSKEDYILNFAPEEDGEEYYYTNYDIVYGMSAIRDDNSYGEYNYIPDKEWASAKENGEDIIIIRYYRSDDEPYTPPEEPDNPPEEPDNPPEEPDEPPRKPKDPDDPPKEPETPPEEPETPPEEPETPPETPETPPEEPETPPETPEYPTELPDPNDPNSPEEITIIGPNGVPLTYIKFWDPEKEEWVYLPEDEIPLAPMDGTPQTGDEAQPVLWGVLCAASLGAVWAMLPRNRKKRSIRRNRQR